MTAALLPAAGRTLAADRSRKSEACRSVAGAGDGRRAGGPVRTVAGYRAMVGRRRTTISVGVATGLLAALAFLLETPPTFAATEAVLVLGLTSQVGSDGRAVQVNLDTEAQLVGSAVIARLAADGIGVDSDTVRSSVGVTVPTNTTIMKISYRAANPTSARDGAHAVAAAYLAYRKQQATDAQAGDRRAALAVLDAGQRQLAELAQRQRAGSPEPTDAATQRLLRGRLADAARQLATLSSAVAVGGRTIQPATRPGAPQWPDPVLVVLSGLAAGLLLGLTVAVARDRVDRTVADSDDVLARFGLPVLGTLRAPLRAGSAAQRRLANCVLARADTAEPAGVVLVAPLSPRVSGAATALAQTLAFAGHPTTLLRRPAAPSDVAAGAAAAPGRSARRLTVQDVPDGFVGGAVRVARGRGDIVVLDGGADDTASAVAARTDAVLLVVDYTRTSAQTLAARLARPNTPHPGLIGIVGVQPARRVRRRLHPAAAAGGHR